MYIFQWLPYLDKKRNKQVTRIFPNQKYNVNINNLIINNIKLQYKANFPENVKEERVYEHLVFIASDEEIAFIEEFTDMDGLNRVYYNSKLKMEKYTTGYTIIN